MFNDISQGSESTKYIKGVLISLFLALLIGQMRKRTTNGVASFEPIFLKCGYAEVAMIEKFLNRPHQKL